jgi:hypothetical protein
MPDLTPVDTLALSQEQLDLLRRPRNEEWERAVIAESKVHFLLLAMLSSGEIAELIDGQKVGKFWVTPEYRIAMEPHEVQLDSDPRVVQFLKTQRNAIRNQVDLLATEARYNKGHAQPVHTTSSEALPVPAPAIPAPTQFDLSQFRSAMVALDRTEIRLGHSSISYPFGQILDNTGQRDCTSCTCMPGLLAAGQPCADSSCPCFRNYQRHCGFLDPFPETLLTVYANQAGLPPDLALEELQERLGISMNAPLALPPTAEKSKIIRKRATDQLLPLIPDACHSVAFRTPNGQLALGGIAAWRLPDDSKATLPLTLATYSTGGWIEFLYIPFEKPYPLLNADRLHQFPSCSVVLTDCIEAAASLWLPSCPMPPIPSPLGEIRTSWYGGREAVPHVDWNALKGREVIYWVLPHSRQPLEHHVATAVEVFFRLRAVPNLTLRFAVASDLFCWNSVAPMNPDEFLEYAKGVGLSQLIDHLESEARKGERRPMRRGDRKITPAGRPLLFPAVLRAEETAVLYAKKGAGKSALAMRMAFCAATGTSLCKPWGREGLQATKVLYLDGEMGDSTLGERVDSNRADLENQGISDDLFSDHYERLNLYSDEGRHAAQQLIDSLNSQKPLDVPVELVVVDNLTSMSGGADLQSG